MYTALQGCFSRVMASVCRAEVIRSRHMLLRLEIERKLAGSYH